jgi:hypothetical protein
MTTMNRKINFKAGWSAAPPGVVGRLSQDGKSTPGLLAEFTLADAKLYFVLAEACKYSGEIRASNADLMEATGLDNRALRRARKRLHEEFRVIHAMPADGRQEHYIYRVMKSASKAKTEPANVDNEVVQVPREILMASLNPVLSLEGAAARKPNDSVNP